MPHIPLRERKFDTFPSDACARALPGRPVLDRVGGMLPRAARHG